MMMITEDQIAQANAYGHRFDIGMARTDRQLLDRRVKCGKAIKVKAFWPFFTWGTCLKTCYINTETVLVSEA